MRLLHAGIVVTLTAFHDQTTCHDKKACEGCDLKGEVTAALEGNLCRCTGYSQIFDAAVSVDTAALPTLSELYPTPKLLGELAISASDAVVLGVAADELEGEQRLFVPSTLEEAARWKAEHPEAILVAGATEIGVPMSVKGLAPREIISLAQVVGLDEIKVEADCLFLGARATWTQVQNQIGEVAPEFAEFLRRWGSPQLRNAGTVAGSLMSGLPISDSLPYFLVSEAKLELVGTGGARQLAMGDFLADRSLIRSDELVSRILVPLKKEGQQLRLFKVSKRRAFDRSIVSVAILLEAKAGKINEIKIAFGGVAETVIRLPQTEAFLTGKPLERSTWSDAAGIALSEISPASNYAASREYREQLVANLIKKIGREFSGQN